MAIQWFPGHMHKARKEIAEVMPQVDLIIEVLDARIPYASENPLVESLRDGKPCIKVLNKSDLADPKLTQAWIEHLEKSQGVKALALTTERPAEVKQILNLCREMLPHRAGNDKMIRTMIMGIPNVGKSTIINTLAGRTVAKTGNEPAVTRAQQRIKLEHDVLLSDTPGFLWPKFENPNCGYRLAFTGAVKDTAMEYEDVAMWAAGFLRETYPQVLHERYKLEELEEDDLFLLEALGRARGCLRPGGRIDLHKASEILLIEYRQGKLGRLTLETPEQAEREKQETAERVAKEEAAKKAKKEARKADVKKRRRKNK